MVLLVKDPSPAAFAGPGSYAAAEKPHALIAYLAASVANWNIPPDLRLVLSVSQSLKSLNVFVSWRSLWRIRNHSRTKA
jgi:hypothetical protein